MPWGNIFKDVQYQLTDSDFETIGRATDGSRKSTGYDKTCKTAEVRSSLVGLPDFKSGVGR